MRRNNSRFNPRQYEEHLSPFGRKVLGTLIKQWNASDRNNNLTNYTVPSQFHQALGHQPHRDITSHRRVLTFEDQSLNKANHTIGDQVNLQNNLTDDHLFAFPSSENGITFPAPSMSTAAFAASTKFAPSAPHTLLAPPSLLTPAVFPKPVELAHPVLTSAELVTASNTFDQDLQNRETTNKDNSIKETKHDLGTVEDYTNQNDPKLDDAFIAARTVLDKCRIVENVNWDDMFDTELLSDVDIPVDNTMKAVNSENIFNIQFPESSNTQAKIGKTHKDKKGDTDIKNSKRKNQSKVTDVMSKKVKKINCEIKTKSKTISKNGGRNENFTESIKNWLNDVDPNNPVDESQEPLEFHKNNKSREKNKPTVSIQKAPNQKNKKVVQAQLANKGGIMKFGKPSKDTDEKSKEETKTDTQIKLKDNKDAENKLKDNKEKAKEKKSKPKFIAPVKSQIPIKDVTYQIHELDKDVVKKLNLNKISDQEIIALLMYSNGFCQLNSQHTEDACVPEAVMFHMDNNYFYLQGEHHDIADVLSKILQNNTIICYEGKALLNHLSSKIKLDFDVICKFNIVDVKIAGCLLEPDSPPETFSALQRLMGSEPEYTIATTCEKQKTAWYATLLSDVAVAIRNKLELEDLWEVFVDIEMQILPIIADMEQRGVCVDMEKLKEMEKILLTKMKQVESECTRAAGRSFQINSTVQVRALLYDELKLDEKAGLKVRGTLTTGAKSTSETMLKSLVSVHPLPRLILEYRHLHKAHATFFQGVAQYVRGGVVRPVWVQTAAATGRIASSNPNLQAIPKVPFSLRLFPESGVSDEEALRFRCVYVARADHVLLAADWRHVECRVFARAAADTSLQRALEAPDLFRRLAADWLQKPEEVVSSADRERTKRIVYASLYGAGPRKLMEILDVDYSQALSIAASFDRTFPSLRSFGRRVAAECLAAGGRVATLCGRARTLPHIASNDASERSHAERQALNFIVQGSAADVCKLAMGRAVRDARARGLRARLLLQIHDELVWEVHRQDLPCAAEVIRTAMEQCGSRAGLTSLPVAMAVGRSWGELEPYPPNPTDSIGDWQPPLFDP